LPTLNATLLPPKPLKVIDTAGAKRATGIIVNREFHHKFAAADTIVPRMTIGPIQLLKQATPGQRHTRLAAALGWVLDAL
jgi:hypothetical protein